MAKPDPALLDPRRYPVCATIATRYADLDPNKHINNIAIAAMFEDARIRLLSEAFSDPSVQRSVMVANFTIDYLSQSHYPAAVNLHSAVTHIGRTSIGLLQLATQDDRAVALGSAVMVLTDGQHPIPLPEDWTSALQGLNLRP